MAPTAGRPTNGLSIATPRKTASAPIPTQRMPAPPTRPAAIAAIPSASTTAPAMARRCRDATGRAMSSRMAATGGIRVARRAGPTAATIVTTIPTT